MLAVDMMIDRRMMSTDIIDIFTRLQEAEGASMVSPEPYGVPGAPEDRSEFFPHFLLIVD
jgi:hypothetical protein